ncbi:hydrophobic/amphiphilic exporter-1, HAE1 family [Chitinophaga terrae (ex Kim and Jung 2007)]|uniref:Hydrophobic/amphiphilic exporter-1, HAE1 family n=1 Tax=Chitinophaga terrae (ex Kim and Jung 2007) TaxID=408074 RepID=A0A1H4G413_9BACT|nr:efflux RND transporter permease subunit [Chitinophaga terrae (ex Kim and Jung 2007)]GEP92970.1 multidrug ABC transporter [Chitinophaga terrae (ex Kim and Jung 2007)]SEB04319.1 hydrophobic/amphiphilic exporter-1, HAE1 family [Chitinophaga terrae (ex Kim and Jung 2007)]
MKITEVSIKRPTIVVVVFTILTLLGVMSYKALNYELLPKFSSPIVTISTVYPGASPNEVESTVTKKIEDAVASMEKIKKIISKSSESLSIITVELNNDANVDIALQDAQRKVNAILADLPGDAKPPSLNKFSLDDLPIMTLSATANMDDKKFYDLVDKKLQPLLSRLPGVAQVSLIGGQEREIQVNVDPKRLQAFNLSILQVRQLITNANLDFPTGKVKSANEQILVRLAGKYKNVDQLRNLVLKTTENGTQVRLSDVADVQDAQKDAERIARVDGVNAIALQVQKQTDANAVTVSEEMKKTIAQIEKDYAPNGLKILVANDSSDFTLESADSVIHDLILAVILVAVVMLLFLHSIRSAIFVMISIPASLIATFIGMKLMGFSLNLMSLLGLSLVVGILVDDAIVVLENIYRHMEMGKNRVRAAYEGVKEIGFTVTSITLVIVVVFLPISLTNELVSKILREFCVVVMISTMLSLLSSFMIVPLLSSRFGKLEHITGKNIFEKFILWFERQLQKFTVWMTGLLKWALSHKLATVVIAIGLLLASFMLLGKGYIGGEFIPKGDRGQFIVLLEMPKDASVEQTNQATRTAEKYLNKKPEITRLITTVGQTSEDGFGTSQSTAYKSEITVMLVDPEHRKDASDIYAAKIKKELKGILPGVKVKTTDVSILGTAERAPVELVVMGSELDSVMKFAKRAMDTLRTVDGATEIKLTVEDGNPEINVQVDRDKMAALGLTLDAVGGTMQTAFSGTADDSKVKFRQGDYEYDINIRFDDFNRKNLDNVANIQFLNDKGQLIKLSQFATITEGSGPSQLERRDKNTSVSVQAQVMGRPSGTVTQEFAAKLEKMDKPVGISYLFGGDAENQGDSFGTLGAALLISIVMVYLIMVALYDNYIYPFVVLFSIPLAIIGALLALALTNNTLNIFTILGMIMLIGLVAKNAIILVDFTNQMKEQGQSTYEALIHANNARLRPILMTTIAMVIGMLPIALATGGVASTKNGLAWVIIGGLISSMFLTLIVVPVIYMIVDKIMAKFGMGRVSTKRYIRQRMVAPYEETALSEIHQN